MPVIEFIEDALPDYTVADEHRCKHPLWELLIPLHVDCIDPGLFGLRLGIVLPPLEGIEDMRIATVFEELVHPLTSLMLEAYARTVELAIHREVVPTVDIDVVDILILLKSLENRLVVFNKESKKEKD
jgi:hypothetical protein